MTDSSDYRLVLDSEFKRIHETLGYIKEQTTKTNSRVTHLEDAVIELRLADSTHIINCPLGIEVKNIKEGVKENKDEIDKELLEYKFFKKYPKMILIIIALISLLSVYRTFIKDPSTKKDLTNEIRLQESVPKTIRGVDGSLYMIINNNGVTDTVKVR